MEIQMGSCHLTLPISEEDARNLAVGDIVFLSGDGLQLTGAAHRRTLEYASQGKQLPFDPKGLAIYHSYTCFTDHDGCIHCEFIGASTSTGCNKYEPEFVKRYGTRVVIGKGGMDENTKKVFQEVGAVYLAQAGGCSVICTEGVSKINQKYWEDLGPNLALHLTFKNFGPLIVAMDSKGNSLFDNMNENLNDNLNNIREEIDRKG